MLAASARRASPEGLLTTMEGTLSRETVVRQHIRSNMKDHCDPIPIQLTVLFE